MQAKQLKGQKIINVEILSTGYVKLTLEDGTSVIVSIAFFIASKENVTQPDAEEEEDEEEEDEEEEEEEDEEDEEEEDEEEEDEEDEEEDEEEEDEELEWSDLKDMDEEELVELIDEEELKVKPNKFKTESDLREAVAKELGIDIPKKKKKK